ncbi:transposase [Amycolatopsis sp. cg5]|uniref:IS110 family transposase n=1 Tax=Amycolatopsis sp. cg5 TaxID=3238802 RepID=UPI003523ED6F
MSMVVIGIDPHKSSHTAVAVDHNGRKLAQKTVKTDAGGILALWRWAAALASAQVLWAVEDGRGLAGRLVRTLIGHGAEVVWVPPKLMAQCRASARTRGACHANCVGRGCTKIDRPGGRSEGTPSDAEHIASSQ